jgi:hypothetical protein
MSFQQSRTSSRIASKLSSCNTTTPFACVVTCNDSARFSVKTRSTVGPMDRTRKSKQNERIVASSVLDRSVLPLNSVSPPVH